MHSVKQTTLQSRAWNWQLRRRYTHNYLHDASYSLARQVLTAESGPCWLARQLSSCACLPACLLLACVFSHSTHL